MKLCKWFCISEVSSLNVTRPSCRISSLNCLAIVQDRTHQFCRVVTRTRSISLLLTQWSNSGGIWLTRSKGATQAVCPTVIEAIFEQEFDGSELFSFSSFEQLAKAQASWLFEKKKSVMFTEVLIKNAIPVTDLPAHSCLRYSRMNGWRRQASIWPQDPLKIGTIEKWPPQKNSIYLRQVSRIFMSFCGKQASGTVFVP